MKSPGSTREAPSRGVILVLFEVNDNGSRLSRVKKSHEAPAAELTLKILSASKSFYSRSIILAYVASRVARHSVRSV